GEPLRDVRSRRSRPHDHHVRIDHLRGHGRALYGAAQDRPQATITDEDPSDITALLGTVAT
ncbi:MAG: hypothetical protein ACYC2O_08120, partial [Microthrixaceae bacterium]